jgi:hypothetical protein
MSIEQLLETALRENKDIQLAEAKVREAENELNRIRLEVSQKIFAQRREWEVQRARIKEYEARAQAAEQLFEKKAISEEELRLAKVNLEVNQLLLAKLEEELPFILGRTPNSVSVVERAQVSRNYTIRHAAREQLKASVLQAIQELDAGSTANVFSPNNNNNTLTVVGSPEVHAVATAIIQFVDKPSSQGDPQELGTSISRQTHQKLMQALSTPVEAKFDEVLLWSALDALRDSADGIRFVGADQVKVTVTLDLKAPLGTVLEAISDVVGVRFDVREYGVLVSPRGSAEAGSLIDLWKHHRVRRDPKD